MHGTDLRIHSALDLFDRATNRNKSLEVSPNAPQQAIPQINKQTNDSCIQSKQKAAISIPCPITKPDCSPDNVQSR